MKQQLQGFRRKETGFTLIEVLLAMSLMSVLVVMYGGSITTSIKIRNKMEKKVRDFESLLVLADRIEGDIRASYLEVLGKDHTETGTRFVLEDNNDGEHPIDRLSFTTHANLGNVGMVREAGDQNQFAHTEISYELKLQEDSELYDLLRRDDVSLDNEPTEGGNLYKLVDGIQGVNITVLERDTNSWVENWDSREKNNTLPRAVSIVIWYGGIADDNESWRPLVKTMYLPIVTGGDYRTAPGTTTDAGVE